MAKIIKILMRGFKSFAVKTELVLGEHFNVVLGPNGAGKSNVLDAICFVLGKGSARSMRAEKSANLIYNGGKTKKPAKEGEVSIYFDNSDKSFPSDQPVIKVTRIVRQSGQSVYKINDETRTRQQILDLMGAAKINPDGYNIILQGDIVRFVEMSGEERRKIVEDIAGISIYEEKKQKALNELNKVEEKLKEAEIILTERKTYLDELRAERDQALKFRDIKDKISQNKASFTHMKIKGKKSDLSEKEKKIAENKAAIGKIQKEIDEMKKDVLEKKDEVKKISSEIEEKGEKDQVALHKDIENLRVDTATNKQRIGTCENEITRVISRKDQLQKSLAEITEKIDSLKDEEVALEKRNKEKQESIDSFQKKIDEFKKKNQLDGKNEIELDIENIDKKADEEQSKIQELRERQQDLMREKDRLEFQVQAIEDKIAKVGEVEKEHKNDIKLLKDKQERSKKIASDINKLVVEDSSLASQIGNAKTRLYNIKEEIARLNARSITIKESTLSDIAIKKVLEQKDAHGRVHGLVTDLGKVKQEYSLALEIAASARMKSIVVENDATGANLIKYLKQNKFGTATFLPLNKIRQAKIKPEAEELIGARGVIGFASDLVSFDPKYKNIFSYVFGSTLVVEDINVARRIGIGKARMVTLDGDLVETSGSMHGGYRSRKKQGLGFKEIEITNGLTDFEKQEKDHENILSVLEKRRGEGEDEIYRLREEKASLDGEIIRLEKSLHLEEGDLTATISEKSDAEKKFKEIDKELSLVQENINSQNKVIMERKIEKQKLRSMISELRNPKLLAELNTFEEKKSELKDEVNQVRVEFKNIGTQITNILLPEKENILKILKQHNKEEEEFREEIIRLKEKIKGQEKSLREKEKTEQAFNSQFKSLFNKRNKINDAIQKNENRIIGKEEQVRRVEHKANDLSIEQARVKAELAALEEEFKQYRDVKIITNKNEEQLYIEIKEGERMIEKMGNVNMKALEIYESVEKEHQKLMEKKSRLTKEKEDVFIMMNEVESKKKELFMRTFDIINKNFQGIFEKLSTKGGQAFLSVENPEDPFEAGININVRITGKKFVDLRSLSGGEKTLTALSLIFAIQEHEPASFYILDEVDAALDKHNSEKLAKFVGAYSKRAQYVMITHNDSIIAEAQTLYGISMNEHGMTKVVSLKV